MSRSVPEKLLGLLDAFSRERSAHSLSELARRTGLPLPTAHRLVGELIRRGAACDFCPFCRIRSRNRAEHLAYAELRVPQRCPGIPRKPVFPR
jgi:predicted transcriptional regulator